MPQELTDRLRAWADGFGVAGQQYATLCADLREAADALSPTVAPVPSIGPANGVCVIDGDVIPGTRCASCED